MPLYEYACKKCDHHFDVRHSADEVPELTCPICQHEVRKVFHAAGIIFKGSGWYVTDNASKTHDSTAGKSSESIKPSAPAAEPAAEKSTESAATPAATPAAAPSAH